MNPKLILVEGLTGVGKTTIVNHIKAQLENQGNQVVYYEEGCAHPADMAWQAYLTKEEYHQFVAECLTLWMDSKKKISDDELVRRIEEQSRLEDGFVTIAYRNIKFPEEKYNRLVSKLEKKEIHRGYVSFDKYREIHLKSWSRFCQKAIQRKEIVIFESAFLKNQVLEILSSYELSDEAIIEYIMELSQTVMLLDAKVIYAMSPDVEGLVDAMIEERKNENDLSCDWFTQMENWVRNTLYGRKNRLAGKEGIIRFFEENQRIDYMILHKIGLPVTWVLQKE